MTLSRRLILSHPVGGVVHPTTIREFNADDWATCADFSDATRERLQDGIPVAVDGVIHTDLVAYYRLTRGYDAIGALN
jgi:hypothetical protein